MQVSSSTEEIRGGRGNLQGAVIIDVDAVAQYLSTMGEKVSDEYADRYGQERIHFVSE